MKHRQNFPESEQFPQAHLDALHDFGYAVVVVTIAGIFGAFVAFMIWGFK